MIYRYLFMVIAAFLVAAPSAGADDVFVRGRDKPVVGTVKSEDAKAVIVTVKKTDESIPAVDVLDIHYDSVGPVALRLSGGAYKMAKDADKEAHTTGDPIKSKASTNTAIFKYGESL